MNKKYNNKYRIASSRAKWWDYSANAAYFITICTGNREHFFGEIKNGKMNLSNVGILADVFWHEIKIHSKNIELDAFVVMPNHIHGILILNTDSKIVSESVSVETRHALSLSEKSAISFSENDFDGNIENTIENTIENIDNFDLDKTRHALSLRGKTTESKTFGQQRFQNPGKNSVSSIIGSYKSAVTKHANRLGLQFGWQTRFHDHIIKNDNEFNRIANYIENNISNWNDDKFY